MKAYTKLNLKEVEDSAKKFGSTDNEARFPSKLLDLEKLGFSLQKLFPNKRSSFGHKHKIQEEVVIVIGGSGKIKLNDEIISLQPFDAVRIAPGVMQALSAGSEGLEYLVLGAPKTKEKDWEMIQDWWDGSSKD